MAAIRNPVEIFEVEAPYAGRLSVCIRPRGGMWLADDIRRLRRGGWDVLVSALMPGEIAELQLGGVERRCRDHGVEYFPFPIGNLQVPPVETALEQLDALRERLQSGKGVTAHCHGSIGRSPLIVASLLVLGGVPAPEAWARIARARGEQVPDTYEQRDWVDQLTRQDGAG
jgi:protein-tyrosine phosphatase